MRKCVVCHHPEREAIEEEFLNWHSPFDSATHHKIPVRSLYRHAVAAGLTRARRGNMRAVLDRLLDRVERHPSPATTSSAPCAPTLAWMTISIG